MVSSAAGPAAPAGHRRRRRVWPLAPAALALLVFCASDEEHSCVHDDAAIFAVASTCGPPLVLTVAYSGAVEGCSGDCIGALLAPGANGAGLPEEGEASGWSSPHAAAGGVLLGGNFAFVGKAPVNGGAVERRCRAFPPRDPVRAAVGTVLPLVCEGDVPAAFCSGTLTFQGVP